MEKKLRCRFLSLTFNLLFIDHRFISRLISFSISPYRWKLPSSRLLIWQHLGTAGCMQRLYNYDTIFLIGSKNEIEEKFWPSTNKGISCVLKRSLVIVATIFAHLWTNNTDPALSMWVLFSKSVTDGLIMFFDISIIVWIFSRWILHWSVLIFIQKISRYLRSSKIKVSSTLWTNIFIFILSLPVFSSELSPE